MSQKSEEAGGNKMDESDDRTKRDRSGSPDPNPRAPKAQKTVKDVFDSLGEGGEFSEFYDQEMEDELGVNGLLGYDMSDSGDKEYMFSKMFAKTPTPPQKGRFTTAVKDWQKAESQTDRTAFPSGVQWIPFKWRNLYEIRMCEMKDDTVQEVAYVEKEVADVFNLENPIFMREVYNQAFTAYERHGHIMVLGSPGIGKSVLGQFIFLREISEGNNVVYVKGKSACIVIGHKYCKVKFGDGGLDAILSDAKPGYTQQEFVLIFDSKYGLHEDTTSNSKFKKLLVIHSPSAKIRDSRKDRGIRQTVLLPPWSETELQRWNIVVCGTLGEDTVRNEVLIRDKYEISGGIVRFMTPDDTLLDVQTETLDAVLLYCGSNETVSRQLEGGFLYTHLNTSGGKEIHQILEMYEDCDGEVPVTRYRFLSDYIWEQVVAGWSKIQEISLFGLIRDESHIEASVRGKVFENMLHHTFDGKQFQELKIQRRTIGNDDDDDAKKEEMIVLANEETVRFYNMEHFPKEQFSENKYIRPNKKNLAGIDSFRLTKRGGKDVLELYQMTISLSHDVVFNGLMDLKRAVGEKWDKLTVVIVFLVSEAAYQGFQRKQSITRNPEKRKWPKELDQEVWVVKARQYRDRTLKDSGEVIKGGWMAFDWK